MARCLIASSVCASKKSCGRAKSQFKKGKEYLEKFNSLPNSQVYFTQKYVIILKQFTLLCFYSSIFPDHLALHFQ